MRALVLVTATLLLVAGCGGGDPAADADLDEKLAEIERAAPNVGLGEASPPPALTAGWKTDFSKHEIDLSEILSGGPPKDGIPAIDDPRFDTAVDVDWLSGPEPVIALTVEGETRGYPIQVLIWHEIVNDVIQGRPVAVTFCPLCNTALAFDRRVDGKVLDFGTTGNLRDSDLVMYDRQTESWWQQFGGRAIVGSYTGAELEQLGARIVSWDEFRTTYPESRVLNRTTGFTRNYGSNPYVGYDDVASGPLFPVRGGDDRRLQPKERVVYVERGDEAVAVPFAALAQQGEVRTEIGGDTVLVRWRKGVASALDSEAIRSGRAVGAADVTLAGERIPFSEPFWFAVAAFRPDVRIVRR